MIDLTRMMSLPATCGVAPPVEALTNGTSAAVDACFYSCCCSISISRTINVIDSNKLDGCLLIRCNQEED
uniref:Uncharacterized protein n=1 Tax=Oryza glumipatula TaxID=40148 RepID=A0A0E0AJK5_9ORYZ